MTPEERARQIVQGDQWLDQTYYTQEDGEEFSVEVVDQPALERLIAEAIQEATKEQATEIDRLRAIIRRAYDGDPDDLYEEAARLAGEQEGKAS